MRATKFTFADDQLAADKASDLGVLFLAFGLQLPEDSPRELAAAIYGYESWDELVSSFGSSTTTGPTDKELGEADAAARRASAIQALCDGGIPASVAEVAIKAVRPFHDHGIRATPVDWKTMDDGSILFEGAGTTAPIGIFAGTEDTSLYDPLGQDRGITAVRDRLRGDGFTAIYVEEDPDDEEALFSSDDVEELKDGVARAVYSDALSQHEKKVLGRTVEQVNDPSQIAGMYGRRIEARQDFAEGLTLVQTSGYRQYVHASSEWASRLPESFRPNTDDPDEIHEYFWSEGGQIFPVSFPELFTMGEVIKAAIQLNRYYPEMLEEFVMGNEAVAEWENGPDPLPRGEREFVVIGYLGKSEDGATVMAATAAYVSGEGSDKLYLFRAEEGTEAAVETIFDRRAYQYLGTHPMNVIDYLRMVDGEAHAAPSMH